MCVPAEFVDAPEVRFEKGGDMGGGAPAQEHAVGNGLRIWVNGMISSGVSGAAGRRLEPELFVVARHLAVDAWTHNPAGLFGHPAALPGAGDAVRSTPCSRASCLTAGE